MEAVAAEAEAAEAGDVPKYDNEVKKMQMQESLEGLLSWRRVIAHGQ